MLLDLQLAVDDELLAAERHEDFVDRAEIRRGLLDDAAQLLEAPRHPGADLADLAIDLEPAAEVNREGDTLRQGGIGHRRAERYRGRVEGHRVVRTESRHRVEEQCEISDVARHRPLHRLWRIEIVRGAARHPAGRRAEADRRAVGAGPPQRPAMVGAVRQPDLAGCHRNRAAAGGAAAGKRSVPGIARAAEHLVEGAATRAELRRVRLAHHDAALALDALDQRMRLLGHVVGEDRRAVGGAHAAHVGQVLDRNGKTGEPARLIFRLIGLAFHDPLCVLPGTIEAQSRHGVHGRLDLGHACCRSVHQVEGRNLLLLEARNGLDCGKTPKFVAHALPPTASVPAFTGACLPSLSRKPGLAALNAPHAHRPRIRQRGTPR